MINKEKALKKSKNKPFMSYDSQGRKIWEVRRVVAKKTPKSKPTLWKVEWEGFPKNSTTWEPRNSFDYDPDTLLQENDESKKETNSISQKVFQISARTVQIRYQKPFSDLDWLKQQLENKRGTLKKYLLVSDKMNSLTYAHCVFEKKVESKNSKIFDLFYEGDIFQAEFHGCRSPKSLIKNVQKCKFAEYLCIKSNLLS